MKTFKSIVWMVGYLFVLNLFPLLPACADTTPPVKLVEKSFTGTIKSVDQKKRLFEMHGLIKKFTIGPACIITLPDKSTGTISSLSAGETIMVQYHLTNGVPVADRIEIRQQAVN